MTNVVEGAPRRRLHSLTATSIFCRDVFAIALFCAVPFLDAYRFAFASNRPSHGRCSAAAASSCGMVNDAYHYQENTTATAVRGISGAGTTTSTHEARSQQPFLIHKGRSADMIRRSPSLAGISVCKGWSTLATSAFKVAVEAVALSNPILTGHAYEVKKGPFGIGGGGELWIQPGTFRPGNHSYVTEIDAPDDMVSLKALSDTEALDYVLGNISPLLDGCEMVSEQIRDKLPLFEAKIVRLKDDYACFSIKMSHCVGDGVTFFELVSQINSYMNGWDAPPIDWRNSLKPTHEFYPDSFSPRDVEISYGLPFMIGLVKNFFSLSQRRFEYILLDKKKISKKKRELRSSHGSNSISSNDIITSALCESNESSDILVFTENVRSIKPGVERNTGGNFLIEVPFLRTACIDPFAFRKLVEKGGSFATNGIPLSPFLCGRVGRITSLATITQKITFPGAQIVCQFPFISFIKDLPLDVAVIFRLNEQYWAVLHNFEKLEKSALLNQISK